MSVTLAGSWPGFVRHSCAGRSDCPGGWRRKYVQPSDRNAISSAMPPFGRSPSGGLDPPQPTKTNVASTTAIVPRTACIGTPCCDRAVALAMILIGEALPVGTQVWVSGGIEYILLRVARGEDTRQ